MRWYYRNSIEKFISAAPNNIIGVLTLNSGHGVEQSQLAAWETQIRLLQENLRGCVGQLFFEYSIPRMGRRVDVVLLVDGIVIVLEFKVGQRSYDLAAIDQVWDYALDLKNFHSSSHNATLVPVLVATEANARPITITESLRKDGVINPVLICGTQIRELIDKIALLEFTSMGVSDWERGKYLPTPTIVEAALALYGGHNVEEIFQRGADAKNLSNTVSELQELIRKAGESKGTKLICFVTGVPGAGKTLVGLDIATKNVNKESALYSVYLSGNGPLVKVLQEALALDRVKSAAYSGEVKKKGEARREVKLIIQNVHTFRDECIATPEQPPPEHVVIFDESQRAWNRAMTVDFMQRKKRVNDFDQSEPEYLISCMDRHKDWAVIICLVGGGQEINRGEAGIGEWFAAIGKSFHHWKIYCSPELVANKYVSEPDLLGLEEKVSVTKRPHLHLSTSMRSFRAAKLSEFVNSILELDNDAARQHYTDIQRRYPLYLTRDVAKARTWLKAMARGTERCGLAVSSKAYRLRPHAIDARNPVDPVHWFLGAKDDVRSSYYLEDVATEFQIQGLELDWVGVTWDADLRYNAGRWSHYQFVGNKWKQIKKSESQKFLENAYRVLMTRARQGMVIVVPEGSDDDQTRKSAYYDPTYKFFRSLGLQEF